MRHKSESDRIQRLLSPHTINAARKMSIVGDPSFPIVIRQLLELALLCSGPAAACVVHDAEGRPTFAVEGPMHWICASRGQGKTETAQGESVSHPRRGGAVGETRSFWNRVA